MKKIQVVVLSAIVAVGILVTSCEGGVSTSASLKTDKDTLSYAFGANLYRQGGLDGYLAQMGVLLDTTAVHMSYKAQMEAESADKVALEKEMHAKIDSIVKVNNRNIAEFLKGMQSSIDAPASKTPYLMGVAIGQQLGTSMIPDMMKRVYGPKSDEKPNYGAFLAGLGISLQGKKHQIAEPEIYFTMKMENIRKKEQAKRELEMQEQYAEQVAAGEKFLAENKAKEGVVTLPSGLQYKVVKEGTGAKPTAADVVRVHYHGTLIDGTVFDSSVERGTPAQFNVGGVIPGWTEALLLMPVGSKWTLYIPYSLAYGAEDKGKIPPFSTLIFEVELLTIENAQ